MQAMAYCSKEGYLQHLGIIRLKQFVYGISKS